MDNEDTMKDNSCMSVANQGAITINRNLLDSMNLIMLVSADLLIVQNTNSVYFL